MTLLLDREALAARRPLAAGPLAPLATSLRGELERLLHEGFSVPHEKALLSREGGRCVNDGALLRFDPFSPRAHTCPRCGATYSRERDYLWWVMSYQLWLAERAAHAATLHALTGESALVNLATRILDAYADRYLGYPNRDNALGPTRPFFSTYLESIWLLQMCVALSLVETAGEARALGARVRERVIEPSARLIASFDEGDSNRQVWNVAALLSAGRLLDDASLVEQAIFGQSGIAAHLARGLLPDGSWYEGENYHVFAHRGLWYGVTIAEQLGCPLPAELVRRFEEGFALPLVTALPDLTIPSRRDSQYAISLRQWRFAESFELGLARRDDPRLAAALGKLYGDSVPRRDTGRWRSAADTQPHEEASSLTRADLGWRALLFAREALPEAPESIGQSALLEAQGLAVFRRDDGRAYAALDYGQSGGGHGHPDRLNVLLARGEQRILDDYGTGSYVDPSLHWYRSTLAHNAPLFDDVSQRRAAGTLLAFEERGAAGWVDAEVATDGLAPGVSARRSLVVMTDYLVDRLEWKSDRALSVALPIHVLAEISALAFRPASLVGGAAPEDGFGYVHDSERAHVDSGTAVHLRHRDVRDVEGWVLTSAGAEWWRAVAPGPPGSAERRFSLVRLEAAEGSVTTVWSWRSGVTGVLARDGILVIQRGDLERHEHARRDDGWTITLHHGGARSSIELGGRRPVTGAPPTAGRARVSAPPRPLHLRAGAAPLTFALAERAYRRSEDSWQDAGSPRATITLEATRHDLVIAIAVEKPEVVFRPPNAEDPTLDNEHPDIHSDGVQLYVAARGWDRFAAWLAVPEDPPPRVRVRAVDGAR
ncbi:MAG TPA: heparinase II/III family protein, partial [Candidatus Limnocylindria bacterium]|nr:heparinase II/III family protein [Candidatus Limnocylindria bacterium]